LQGDNEVSYFRSALDRLLKSETFARSESLRRLLRYLAEKSLAGEAAQLSEVTVGVEALGKAADYDPQVDPSVRVQVSRLRGKLAQYYMEEGVNDPVVITLPKGHFQLKFERRFQAVTETRKLRRRLRQFQVLAAALGTVAVALALTSAFGRVRSGYPADLSTKAALDRSRFSSNSIFPRDSLH